MIENHLMIIIKNVLMIIIIIAKPEQADLVYIFKHEKSCGPTWAEGSKSLF